jgi:hypothetical protein
MADGKQKALITGASSGIGLTYAERLAREGTDLVLVARRRDRLEALAEQLRASVDVDILVADLSKPDDLARAEKRLAEDESISLLINNAGFGGYQAFAELDPDRAEELIRLQVIGPTRLTRAALPGMIRRKFGGIINVASLLALSGTLPPNPLPLRATYAGAKSYIVTFTQALAQEIAGTGVKVQVCLPGLVKTEFHSIQGFDIGRLPSAMSTDDFVQASLTALARGEIVCIPGLVDPAMFEVIGEAQRAVLRSANRQAVAARYQE